MRKREQHGEKRIKENNIIFEIVHFCAITSECIVKLKWRKYITIKEMFRNSSLFIWSKANITYENCEKNENNVNWILQCTLQINTNNMLK